MEAATHAIYVHKKLGGPAVPENPIARLMKDDRSRKYLDDTGNLIPTTRKAALARMRTARVVALRRHFDRQHLGEVA